MTQYFDFETYSDNRTYIRQSPVSGLCRIHIDVQNITSVEQAHLLEHCIMEANRDRIRAENVVAFGVTTARRITLSILPRQEASLSNYADFAAVDITDKLFDCVMPLVKAEYRHRAPHDVYMCCSSYGTRNSSRSEIPAAQELSRVLRQACLSGAVTTQLYFGSELSTRVKVNACIPPSCQVEGRSRMDSSACANGVTRFIRDRLECALPRGIVPRWESIDFRKAVLARYHALLAQPAFFIREMDRVLDLGLDADSINTGFEAFLLRGG
ncbi:hypothetical protein [Actinomyces sp.]|uniref:hypothetical protein n=1 Tax=Actinomyces sp. TaxID=29317 RepID=UPI0026DC390E|nr:hypothetical protein [Actinomyces sp.]MDO4900656.1 hypothetical protein [Actinomyces sp.]